MNQLWAPWRMPYLDDAGPHYGCVLCAKASEADDEQNYLVYRGPLCFVMLNLYPYNSGHLMVVPYQHVGRLPELPPETASAVFTTAQVAVQAIHEVMKPEGFNLGINQGEVAGAGIADHIHLHVVPRWGGDTNFMPIMADAKVMPELLSATATKLRPAFQRITQSQ